VGVLGTAQDWDLIQVLGEVKVVVVDALGCREVVVEGMRRPPEVCKVGRDLVEAPASVDTQANYNIVKRPVMVGIDSCEGCTCSRRMGAAPESLEEKENMDDHVVVEDCEEAYSGEDEAWPADVGSSCRRA
jgi:hypothetical protein